MGNFEKKKYHSRKVSRMEKIRTDNLRKQKIMERILSIFRGNMDGNRVLITDQPSREQAAALMPHFIVYQQRKWVVRPPLPPSRIFLLLFLPVTGFSMFLSRNFHSFLRLGRPLLYIIFPFRIYQFSFLILFKMDFKLHFWNFTYFFFFIYILNQVRLRLELDQETTLNFEITLFLNLSLFEYYQKIQNI